MPPQKNSGNKGAKRETGVSTKNRRFLQNFLDDIRSEGKVDNVHIGRVLRKMGDGRMEVFYVETKGDVPRTHIAQAVIRGSFRGRGKRSVWIDIGSFVAVAETGQAGSAALEIVAVIEPSHMRDIAKEMNLDSRVLAVDTVDYAQLVSTDKKMEDDRGGFEFDIVEEDNDADINIDNI